MDSNVTRYTGELVVKTLAGGAAVAGTATTIPLMPIILTTSLVVGTVIAVSYLNNRRMIEVAKLQHKDGQDKFYLQSKSGTIVSAELNQEGQLTATRPQAQEWEYFELLKWTDGRIAFRASNGKYVSADQNRDGLLIANREVVSEWELFHHVQVGEYSAFRAVSGKYVSSREDNHCVLFASGEAVQDWEMFRILKRAS